MRTNNKCSSCSKESYDVIPVARVIEKLDALFSTNDLDGAGRLLEYWEREARNLSDMRGLLEILNEEIGYFRRTADRERALAAVEEAFEIIEQNGLEDNASSGTVYLNGATTMKAFGKVREAMPYYAKAKEIYDRSLDQNDYKMAAFYNNISSAYAELGDTQNAEKACYSAIAILKSKDGYNGEIAVTLVNLAHMYHDADPFDERIYDLMEQAWSLLTHESNQKDGNFAFLCSKCYPSFGFFGYFEYEKHLRELTEKIYAGN